MENKIELYSISELLGRNFFIPSYQRGYRWDDQQVCDLLSDIHTFANKENKKEKEFYCLQPIVVKAKEWKNKERELIKGWEVVDGQQRITTLRILLSYLIKNHLNGKSLKQEYSKDIFSIHYETKESESFLDNIVENYDEDIDLYYISRAYTCIGKWFEQSSNGRDARESILRTLVYDQKNKKHEGVVQIIWYEIEKNPIDTFTRINSGKIPLRNSELIKAIFLQKRNFGEESADLAKLRQIEIANQWDEIEYALQDENLWHFLNCKKNPMPARIEFILDLVCNIAKNKDKTLVDKIGKDRYATFRYFYSLFDGKNNFEFVTEEWKTIRSYFHTIIEWFTNPVWYHYIGFLIYTSDNIENIFSAVAQGVKTKDDITVILENRIAAKFTSIKWKCDEEGESYIDISYSKTNHTKITEILLLFNLEYMVKHCTSAITLTKFPFKFYQEGCWDIEHIDSFTTNPLSDKKSQNEWLHSALVDLPEIKKDLDLCRRIEQYIKDEKSSDVFSFFQSEIIRIAEENENDEETKNSIGNLTLLDSGTNRSYGNALFLTKRKKIIERDKSGVFIPVCTKNVFLKYFDLDGNSRSKWSSIDIKSYRRIIADTIERFLPPKQ